MIANPTALSSCTRIRAFQPILLIGTMKKYCRDLNIVKKGYHKARKTALTKLGDNPNINQKDAMEFAGHKDVKTFIKHYCFSRYSDEQKRLELEKTLNF